jgi:thiol-disulfide isomerase/thioredoxin
MTRFLIPLLIVFNVAGGAGAAELQPFRSGTYAALLAEKIGQPRAVHFWALSCAPCLIELPRWTEIARAHPELAVALVNTDPPEQHEAVVATIENLRVGTLRNLQFADAFTDKLMFEVDPTWHGELPRTSLVARDGSQQKVLGALNQATLDRFLAKR